ncbi:hypothetical protein FRC00_009243 [Tulasnella sp. 408]|nr:hypothetical protein FRC00_009243 [Tulasnella sp. 408]
MDRASESPQDPTKDNVAVNTGRGTSPATAPPTDNPTGSDLIDGYLQHTWAYRENLLYTINLKLLDLKSQRNLHAAIHKLPVELLVYIFRLSLPAPETGPHYMQFLGTLLGVCKHWATMISAGTSLWGSSDQEFTQILRQISPHIHRWETAEIVMPQTEEGRQYLSKPAPRLRRLHLYVPSGFGVTRGPHAQPFDIFNGSAETLEEVKVTPIQVSNVITILRDCPDLVTLIIDDLDITVDMQADPSREVNMTRLENIHFTVGELEGIREVFNGFNAPNCKAFKFHFATIHPGDAENFILTTLAPYFPFFRRMMFEHSKTVIDISNITSFHVQCPGERNEEDLIGFTLYFSATPPDVVMTFLRHLLGEGEPQKPDVRLIIGRDWGTGGLSILEEVSTYCNVVDLWLGAYAVLQAFDTESVLQYLAQPVVIPNLRHLIISGDGWNGEEIEATLQKRYNQGSGNCPPLRIHLIGRGVNANFNFIEDLEAIPMIECASWSERLQIIDNNDL